MVGERAKRKRAPFPALLLMFMVLVLLHATNCGATSSMMRDNATSPYHARMDEPADWMFDSEITRMLGSTPPVTGPTRDRNKPTVKCRNGQPYIPCIDPKNLDSKKRPCAHSNPYCHARIHN